MIPWFEVPSLQAGPLEVDLPTLLAIGGAVTAMGVARLLARRAGLSARRMVDGFALILVSSLFFGHTLDVVLYRVDALQADWRIILPWHGGYSSLGAFVGLTLAVVAVFRDSSGGLRWDFLDPLAAASLVGLAILRVGCFLGHHHAGHLSSFVLAVGYPGGARHDLGLYETLLICGLLAALVLVARRGALPPGFLAVGATSAYCLGRFVLEFLRGDDLELLGRRSDHRYGGLTVVQYGALFVVAASLLWLGRQRRRARNLGSS